MTDRFYIFFSLATVCLVTPFALGAAGSTIQRSAQVAANTVTVHILGEEHPPGFRPALLAAHVNDEIVFVNDAPPPAAYNVIADDGSFSSPLIAPGQQWSVTFDTEGVHEYRDPAFAQQMVGQLIVVPASVTLLPTPNPAAQATALAAVYTRPSRPQPAIPGWLYAIVAIGAVTLLLSVGGAYIVVRRRGRRR